MPDQTSPSPNPAQGGPSAQRPSLVTLAMILAVSGAMWLWYAQLSSQTAQDIDYSAFYALAAQGKVSSVVIEGQDIQGHFKAKEKVDGHDIDVFHAVMPRQDEPLFPLLRDRQVRIHVARDEPPFVVSLLTSLLPFVLMIGVWVWLSRRAQRMGPANPLAGFLKGQTHKFERKANVATKFDDVAGLEHRSVRFHWKTRSAAQSVG